MKNPLALTILILVSLGTIAHATEADDTVVTVTNKNPGATPFISKVTLNLSRLRVLRRIEFVITPKSGSVTRPVSATYTKNYLERRGYLHPKRREIIVPVFGLYAGYTNEVVLSYFFSDGSSKKDRIMIATQPFNDACDYNTPTVFKPRTSTTKLSFDFILIVSSCSRNSPTVIDSDGEVRWVGTADVQAHQARGFHRGVYIMDGTKLVRMELDGEVRVVADYASVGVNAFHHNIDPGKRGMILDANLLDGLHLEVDYAGQILKRWSLREIIRNAMIAGGDDPSGFVKTPSVPFAKDDDWTHNNSVAYRKSDNSITFSSRENFVICLDYETNAIKWILGDKTKLWYQYPSLRKFALSLAPGSIAPAGQHTVAFTRDNRLLLFDNGTNSDHHTPAGVSRPYSAARKYELDLGARVATEVWNFTYNQAVKAPYCSSVYEDASNNYLVNYSNARGFARILALTASGQMVFEYAYPADGCNDGYRSLPIHWENLKF